MLKNHLGKPIFWLTLWLALLIVPPSIRNSLESQQAKEYRLVNISYQKCMDSTEKEYTKAISFSNPSKLAIFLDKYGIENTAKNHEPSEIVRRIKEHCHYVSRKNIPHHHNLP